MRLARALALGFLTFILFFSTSNVTAQVYVDKNGSFTPDGSPDNPYQSIEAGACKAQPNGTVLIRPGVYNETLMLTQPVRLTASGPVVIGQVAGKPRTTLKVVTYNTHLYGDKGGGRLPTFADGTRAAHVAASVQQEDADVVGLQEVWDEELADEIVQTAGYPHHFYSNSHDELDDFLNSGLLLLSRHPLLNPSLTFYEDEVGFSDCEAFEPACFALHRTAPWECLAQCDRYLDGFASKGFVQATIVKDGFQIGIFITHTQAETHGDAVEARRKQLEQLRRQIQQYRIENPAAEVVAMGDLNVVGGSGEYHQRLLPTLRLRDAFRNAPCIDSKPQHTCSPTNPLAQRFGACLQDERLDYVLYSHANAFEVRPNEADVKTFKVSPPMTDDDASSSDLSDHYGVAAEFSLFR